jgi:hypothetical protein
MSPWRVALAVAPSLLFAATVTHFAGRSAWTLDTPLLRVTVLRGGGHVAEIALKSSGAANPLVNPFPLVNPLWIQSRPTIDPADYNPARDAKTYGGGAAARLMSGLAGHSLCFPYWGDPSAAEERAGMTFHGETGIAAWTQTGSGGDWLELAAELPESRTRFIRRLQIRGAVLWLDETARNEAAWDRPVGWCEHVTMGAPFLERGVTRFAASATRGKALGSPESSHLQWPVGRENAQEVDLSTVRGVKTGGEVNNYLVDPSREFGYFAAFNPKFSLVFGYVFRRAEFPWLNVWESYTPELFTRGMEFSNTPVHGTARALVNTPTLWNVPSFEWLGAKASLHKRYAVFSASVPKSFRGVQDVQVSGSHLRIVERSGGPGVTLDLGQTF